MRNNVLNYLFNLCLQPTTKLLTVLNVCLTSIPLQALASNMHTVSGLSLDSFVMMVAVIELSFYEYWLLQPSLVPRPRKTAWYRLFVHARPLPLHFRKNCNIYCHVQEYVDKDIQKYTYKAKKGATTKQCTLTPLYLAIVSDPTARLTG